MNYKEVIEARYNRRAWQELLHDLFRKVSFWETPVKVNVNTPLAKQALALGTITLSDGESIAVYEVELADNVNIERNRRSIRDMLTSDWQSQGHAGAFMFCYRKHESLLRFSYVCEHWGFNSQGNYEKFSTDTQRYTYLLGEGRGCRTAIEQFTTLRNSKQTLSDVTAAFSVEALTKQFYRDLFNWYQWVLDPATNVSFPNDTTTEDDDRDDIETKVIRMITRIMFVWFIKQKELVPERLFDLEALDTILRDFDPYSTTVGNYYNAILQNLFFATLNCEITDEAGNPRKFSTSSKRDVKTLYRYAELFAISEQEVIALFAEVPFLNGGLFECLDKTKTIDGVDRAYNFDGFSRNDARFSDGRFKHRAVVPNHLFFEPERGLISILKRYNFTIEENSPEEQQVALDPELLGKVFENLLGAYNPETQKTARNQSGSFYTPREIVNYMVDESLIAYLTERCGHPVDEIRQLFAAESIVLPLNATKIADDLRAVKILDPACGSGAFPMGLLNRMIDLLGRLSPEASLYDLKLSVIENCLYGSDIQSIAAQITKLRFFISLICDCEKSPSQPNFGIPTLPNLETKFVAANSLIAKKRCSTEGNLYVNKEIEPTRRALIEVRHRHFSARSASEKQRLRRRDQELREGLAQLLADNKDFAPEDALQLAAWNPYDQNAVSPFFDPEWMFGIRDGFDVVIGNPPYVQLQDTKGALATRYEHEGYQTFARTGDLYCLFYERGWQLLKERGHLCFITSNKWMRAGYGKALREFFAKKTNPVLLIDFAGVKIFESATVDTNILLFSKSSNKHATVCAVTDKQNKGSVKNLSLFVQQQRVTCDFSDSSSWVILSPIEQSIKRKIEAIGTPLGEWDIHIYRGVLTGCNEAFIINTAKRDEILSHCQSEDERQRTAALIRPILRGRDIRRYGYVDNGLYLINTHNGIKGKLPRIDINDYPAVKAHLDQYWDKIASRTDRGATPYNLRNCAYMDDFSKPKIVYSEIVSEPQFYLDATGEYLAEATAFLLTGEHLEYLIKLLNSRVLAYIYHCFYAGGGLGKDGYRYKKAFLQQLPLPRYTSTPLCESIEKGTEVYENEILQLYDFTPEETAYLKEAIGM